MNGGQDGAQAQGTTGGGDIAYMRCWEKIAATGLRDYTRNVGHKIGSIAFDYETKTFNYDRGIKLLADVMERGGWASWTASCRPRPSCRGRRWSPGPWTR